MVDRDQAIPADEGLTAENLVSVGGMSKPLRIAIIHYWLVAMRGGERVLERVLRQFPEADLFTHVYDPDAVSDIIRDRPVRTTFINDLPFARRLYKYYLPLMPMALESLDLSGYDLVLSFEAGPAKGVLAPPTALHVCYCHSPMRYIWDAQADYRRSAGPLPRALMSLLFPPLRVWDYATAARVDGFIANSDFVRRRIRRAYGREATVVHPPAAVEAFQPADRLGAEYLWVGQMTPYKRADLAVDAFNRLGLPLLMVGDGEMQRKLKASAKCNIRFSDHLSFAELKDAYATSRGLIHTAEEDFGIAPIEAMASGLPVLAYGRGGVLDTIVPGRTGQFFEEQTVDSLVAAVGAFEAWLPAFEPQNAVARAARFSGERFDQNFLSALRRFAVGHPEVLDRLAEPIPVNAIPKELAEL
jgi:glycosyltransferase involved in cell wall biosynthesis